MNLKGYLFILSAAILWGMIGPLAKLAFQEGIQPMEVAFWRAVLSWGFFGIHAFIKKETRIDRKDYLPVFIFGIMGVSVFYGSYQIAVSHGGAALASVLLYTAPAWVALMSRFFLGEKMTVWKIIALILTLGGVSFVSIGAGGGSDVKIGFQAVFFGLMSGFSYALYYIFGKIFSDKYSSPNIFLYILPIGAMILFPFVTFHPKSQTAWIAIVLLAFLCTYASYFFYYIGLKYMEATRAAITATMEPVMAGIVAYFWWHEYFTPIGYIGSFLILSSVFIMVLEGSRRMKGGEN